MMQKALIISDANSLKSLNETLEAGEHYVEHVSASPNGSWLVILEEGEEEYLDFEEATEEQEQ